MKCGVLWINLYSSFIPPLYHLDTAHNPIRRWVLKHQRGYLFPAFVSPMKPQTTNDIKTTLVSSSCNNPPISRYIPEAGITGNRTWPATEFDRIWPATKDYYLTPIKTICKTPAFVSTYLVVPQMTNLTEFDRRQRITLSRLHQLRCKTPAFVSSCHKWHQKHVG